MWLLQVLRSTNNYNGADKPLYIVDARSSMAANANRLSGRGTETRDVYGEVDIQFMNIANIHSVRASYENLERLCVEAVWKSKPKWVVGLAKSRWLYHVSSILRATATMARRVAEHKHATLVHCSDGWDRTSQLAALTQLCLDPYYRTIDGLIVLIDKDWLAFGHKFEGRLHDDGDERSPVFVQFLDCVHQLLHQFPTVFEFNRELLLLSRTTPSPATTATSCTKQSGSAARAPCTPAPSPSGRPCWPTGTRSPTRRTTRTAPRSCCPRPRCATCASSAGSSCATTNGLLTEAVSVEALDDGEGGLVESRSTTEMQSNWLPNSASDVCMNARCGKPFTLTRRRHHCRECGGLFCSKCLQQRKVASGQRLKVCDACAA